ncbi:hypothetical protein EV121DRAFT_271922 [Schizophyllum commune]
MSTSVSYASFSRALSPHLQALGEQMAPSIPVPASAEESGTATRFARQYVIQGASSIEDVMAIIPTEYRQCLREPLHEVAHIAEKCCAAKTVLAKMTEHKQKGTMPQALAFRAPEVSLSGVFAESDQGSALKNAFFQKFVTTHKANMLDDAISMKSKEVDFLTAKLDLPNLLAKMKAPIDARGAELLETQKIPIFVKGEEDGELRLTGEWKTSPRIRKQLNEMQEDCTLYALRVVTIVDERESRSSQKLAKKKALAQSVDVEMADGTQGAGPSSTAEVRKMVKDLVAKELKVKNDKGKPAQAKKDGKKRSSTSKAAVAAKPSQSPKPKSSGKTGGKPGKGVGKGKGKNSK